MKPAEYDAKIQKKKAEIQLLKQHLPCVKITSIRRHIENEIAQKQTSIKLLMDKALTERPPAGNKSLDKEICSALK